MTALEFKVWITFPYWDIFINSTFSWTEEQELKQAEEKRGLR